MTITWRSRVLQKIVYVLNQCLMDSITYSTDRIHKSRNQGVENGKVYTHYPPLVPTSKKKFASCSTMLTSAGLEVLVLVWGMVLPGDMTNSTLNKKIRTPLGHFGIKIPINQ